MSQLLVIDDEQTICWGLSRMAESLGHNVTTAASAEDALKVCTEVKPDLVITDVRLPGMDGLTAIDQLRSLLGQIPVIVMTAYGDLNTAVEAVRSGAAEYIVKPFDLEQMKSAVERALAIDTDDDISTLPAVQSIGELVGSTPVIQETFRRLALAAAADANVLITGESGTGKELAARAIHRYSRRADGPLVAVNVASLSPSLAESELFGHVRGAFTGADGPRTGLLAQADSGTLFLDEVADIPLPVQIKLLRALEDGEIMPVGSNEKTQTNFRVVSATHQSLLANVKQGTFRHDLYFRLCAFQIEIPPLRERRDDIEELAEFFLNGLVADLDGDRPRPRMAPATVTELRRRPWYGNVRELRNCMEHALILARGGVIAPDHLAPPAEATAVQSAQDANPPALIASMLGDWAESQLSDADMQDLHERLLKLVEPPVFEQALRDSNGQYSLAAKKLGLHRTTLRKKLDQYDIDSPAD